MLKQVLRKTNERTVSLVAVGDVCLSGGVRDVIDRMGAERVFDGIRPWLTAADFRFANLECCVVRNGSSISAQRVDMAASESCLPTLATLFDVVSVANNHTCDYGKTQFLDCLAMLKEHGVAAAGGGRNRAQAENPVIMEKSGLSIGWLAYADWTFGAAVANASGTNEPGVAILSRRRILKAIQKLKPHVDVIVVSLHSDIEFSDHPDPSRLSLCRLMAEQGAHIVLCHHPHVPQGVEVHGRSVIAYGLGNCVFPVQGNAYLEANSPHVGHSYALRVLVDHHGAIEYEILPFEIDPTHRPVPLIGERAIQLEQHIAKLSGELADKGAVRAAWSNVCGRLFCGYLVSRFYYGMRQRQFALMWRFICDLPRREKRRLMIGFLRAFVRDPIATLMEFVPVYAAKAKR
jgi:hypothetical protein